VIDWRRRSAGRDVINPAEESTSSADARAAMAVFVVAFVAAVRGSLGGPCDEAAVNNSGTTGEFLCAAIGSAAKPGVGATV